MPPSRCSARRGVAGLSVEGEDPAAAAQPEPPVASSAKAWRFSGLAAWVPATGAKPFPVEKGWASRGDGPYPMAVVLIAEPNRGGGQALGHGVGRKRAVAVAQQAGGGADPQSTGCILQQVVDGIALELRGVLGVEGDKVDAVEAHQAPVGSQPQISIARLQNGVHGVLRQAGIGAPGLVAIMVQGPLWIERHRGMT